MQSHENELELLRHEHQQAVEALTRGKRVHIHPFARPRLASENQAQREQFVASLADRDQLLADAVSREWEHLVHIPALPAA